MWSALTGLFESTNKNRKMVLREKLKNIKMVKGEVYMAYLTRISKVRDELVAVGVVVTGLELLGIIGDDPEWGNYTLDCAC